MEMNKKKQIREIEEQLKILKKNPNCHTFATIRKFEEDLKEIE